MKYLLLLLLSACSAQYGTSYNLYIDKSFSDAAQNQIIRAADQWTNKTGVAFNIDYSPCNQAKGEYNICIHNSNLQEVRDISGVNNALECDTRTEYMGNSDIYVPIDGYLPDSPYYTHAILHEIGHSIGLNHSNNNADVMFPVDENTTELSDGDVEQYKSLRK